MGGLNGFEIHKDDGFLYGPLWVQGPGRQDQPRDRRHRGDRRGFKIPAAANIDPQNRDNVYVVDTGTGGIWSISLTSKAKKLVASMKPGLDNLAFDSRGRLFVTSMTDNGVYLVDKQTGAHRTIVEGKLAIPADLAIVSENGKDTARRRRFQLPHGRRPDRRGARRDPRAWRDARLSARHLGRAQARVADQLVLQHRRERGRPQERQAGGSFGEFAAPVDALETADGTIYVAELASSNLVKVSADGKQRSTRDLRGPAALARGKTTWFMSPRSPPAR